MKDHFQKLEYIINKASFPLLLSHRQGLYFLQGQHPGNDLNLCSLSELYYLKYN